jgi:hypothetical protein
LATFSQAGEQLMADQSDVESALVRAISDSLNPDGRPIPALLGVACRVYRGWPSSAALDADLAAGWVNITVFPVMGKVRVVPRFADEWHSSPPPSTLLATVSNDSVTFTGTADAGQHVGLLVDGAAYVYCTKPGDTPLSVASWFANEVRAVRPVFVLNATLRFPGTSRLIARVSTDGFSIRELRRQAVAFRLSLWCPSPTLRDLVANVIDAGIARIGFLALADSTAARLRYLRSETIDRDSAAVLYRRDLIYEAEYATTLTETQPAMLFGDLLLEDLPNRLV